MGQRELLISFLRRRSHGEDLPIPDFNFSRTSSVERAQAANLARPFWFALLPLRFVHTFTIRSFLRTHC